MNTEKEQLRRKIIEFQQTIAGLKLNLAQKEAAFCQREKESFLGLLEIMDALDALEKNLETKQDFLDKTARMLGKNILAIHRKMRRHLSAASIVPMEFPDAKATMEYCKILETREAPDLENETLLEVVKNGYLNTQDNSVLRKAEVITVRNNF